MALITGAPSKETIKKVQQIGCEMGVTSLALNNGRKFPCVEWTRAETTMFMLTSIATSDLMMSGAFTRVSTSNYMMDEEGENSNMASNFTLITGTINSANILNGGLYLDVSRLDIGGVRTPDSGVTLKCHYTINPALWDKMQKTFYLVPTELNLEFCPADLIGTNASANIGAERPDFDPENFAATIQSQTLVAKIIEAYVKFFPSFALLAIPGGSIANANGHDGLFAQQYYISKHKRYDVNEHDLSGVRDDDKNILAISNGGAKYTKTRVQFADAEQYLVDFVQWLNSQKMVSGKAYYNATVSLSTFKVTVYAIGNRTDQAQADLHILVTDETTVDWGCIATLEDHAPQVQLERSAIVDEQPLMRPYEKIDQTNFVDYFSKLMIEIGDRLHEKGLEDAVSMDDLVIFIDPRLLVEHKHWQSQYILANPFRNSNDPTPDLLNPEVFYPVNALRNSGLFMFTFKGVLLLYDDAGDIMSGGTERFRFREVVDRQSQTEVVQLLSGKHSFGVSALNFGLTGSNFIGSPLFLQYGMSEREPLNYSKGQANCYNDTAACINNAPCSLIADASLRAEYNSDDGVTELYVDIDTQLNKSGSNYTEEFAWKWNLSNGTEGSATLTAKNAVINIPGDITDLGIRFSVMGTASALDNGTTACTAIFSESIQIGDGDGLQECAHTLVEDMSTSLLSGNNLAASYTVNGTTRTIDFVDSALDLNNPADQPAIAAELDVIFATSGTTVTANGTIITVVIPNVSSIVTVDFLFSSLDPSEESNPFTKDCA